jgi:hypothetical protein
MIRPAYPGPSAPEKTSEIASVINLPAVRRGSRFTASFSSIKVYISLRERAPSHPPLLLRFVFEGLGDEESSGKDMSVIS